VGFLGKNDPLWKDFENFGAKGFMRTRKHVLCANFVKFGRSEVGKIPRCLHDKKNWQALLLSLMCGSRRESVMHRKVFPIVSKASSLSNNELRDITRSPRRVPTA